MSRIASVTPSKLSKNINPIDVYSSGDFHIATDSEEICSSSDEDDQLACNYNLKQQKEQIPTKLKLKQPPQSKKGSQKDNLEEDDSDQEDSENWSDFSDRFTSETNSYVLPKTPLSIRNTDLQDFDLTSTEENNESDSDEDEDENKDKDEDNSDEDWDNEFDNKEEDPKIKNNFSTPNSLSVVKQSLLNRFKESSSEDEEDEDNWFLPSPKSTETKQDPIESTKKTQKKLNQFQESSSCEDVLDFDFSHSDQDGNSDSEGENKQKENEKVNKLLQFQDSESSSEEIWDFDLSPKESSPKIANLIKNKKNIQEEMIINNKLKIEENEKQPEKQKQEQEQDDEEEEEEEDWDAEFENEEEISETNGSKKNEPICRKSNYFKILKSVMKQMENEEPESPNDFPSEWKLFKKKEKESKKKQQKIQKYNNYYSAKFQNGKEFHDWIQNLIEKHSEQSIARIKKTLKRGYTLAKLPTNNNISGKGTEILEWSFVTYEFINNLIDKNGKKSSIRSKKVLKEYFTRLNKLPNIQNYKEKGLLFEISFSILRKHLQYTGLYPNPFFIDILLKLFPEQELRIDLLLAEAESHCYMLPTIDSFQELIIRFLEIDSKAESLKTSLQNEKSKEEEASKHGELTRQEINFIQLSSLVSLHFHSIGYSPITIENRLDNTEFRSKWIKYNNNLFNGIFELILNLKTISVNRSEISLNESKRLKEINTLLRDQKNYKGAKLDFTLLKSKIDYILGLSEILNRNYKISRKYFLKSLHRLDQIPKLIQSKLNPNNNKNKQYNWYPIFTNFSRNILIKLSESLENEINDWKEEDNLNKKKLKKFFYLILDLLYQIQTFNNSNCNESFLKDLAQKCSKHGSWKQSLRYYLLLLSKFSNQKKRINEFYYLLKIIFNMLREKGKFNLAEIFIKEVCSFLTPFNDNDNEGGGSDENMGDGNDGDDDESEGNDRSENTKKKNRESNGKGNKGQGKQKKKYNNRYSRNYNSITSTPTSMGLSAFFNGPVNFLSGKNSMKKIKKQNTKKNKKDYFTLSRRKSEQFLNQSPTFHLNKASHQQISLTSHYLSIQLKLGKIFLQSLDIERAIVLFQDLLETKLLNRYRSKIHFLLGKCYYKKNWFSNSLNHLIEYENIEMKFSNFNKNLNRTPSSPSFISHNRSFSSIGFQSNSPIIKKIRTRRKSTSKKKTPINSPITKINSMGSNNNKNNNNNNKNNSNHSVNNSNKKKRTRRSFLSGVFDSNNSKSNSSKKGKGNSKRNQKNEKLINEQTSINNLKKNKYRFFNFKHIDGLIYSFDLSTQNWEEIYKYINFFKLKCKIYLSLKQYADCLLLLESIITILDSQVKNKKNRQLAELYYLRGKVFEKLLLECNNKKFPLIFHNKHSNNNNVNNNFNQNDYQMKNSPLNNKTKTPTSNSKKINHLNSSTSKNNSHLIHNRNLFHLEFPKSNFNQITLNSIQEIINHSLISFTKAFNFFHSLGDDYRLIKSRSRLISLLLNYLFPRIVFLGKDWIDVAKLPNLNNIAQDQLTKTLPKIFKEFEKREKERDKRSNLNNSQANNSHSNKNVIKINLDRIAKWMEMKKDPRNQNLQIISPKYLETKISLDMSIAANLVSPILLLNCMLNYAELKYLEQNYELSCSTWIEAKNLFFKLFMNGTNCSLSEKAPYYWLIKVFNILKRLTRLLFCYDVEFINKSNLIVFDSYISLQQNLKIAFNRPIDSLNSIVGLYTFNNINNQINDTQGKEGKKKKKKSNFRFHTDHINSDKNKDRDRNNHHKNNHNHNHNHNHHLINTKNNLPLISNFEEVNLLWRKSLNDLYNNNQIEFISFRKIINYLQLNNSEIININNNNNSGNNKKKTQKNKQISSLNFIKYLQMEKSDEKIWSKLSQLKLNITRYLQSKMDHKTLKKNNKNIIKKIFKTNVSSNNDLFLENLLKKYKKISDKRLERKKKKKNKKTESKYWFKNDYLKFKNLIKIEPSFQKIMYMVLIDGFLLSYVPEKMNRKIRFFGKGNLVLNDNQTNNQITLLANLKEDHSEIDGESIKLKLPKFKFDVPESKKLKIKITNNNKHSNHKKMKQELNSTNERLRKITLREEHISKRIKRKSGNFKTNKPNGAQNRRSQNLNNHRREFTFYEILMIDEKKQKLISNINKTNSNYIFRTIVKPMDQSRPIKFTERIQNSKINSNSIYYLQSLINPKIKSKSKSNNKFNLNIQKALKSEINLAPTENEDNDGLDLLTDMSLQLNTFNNNNDDDGDDGDDDDDYADEKYEEDDNDDYGVSGDKNKDDDDDDGDGKEKKTKIKKLFNTILTNNKNKESKDKKELPIIMITNVPLQILDWTTIFKYKSYNALSINSLLLSQAKLFTNVEEKCFKKPKFFCFANTCSNENVKNSQLSQNQKNNLIIKHTFSQLNHKTRKQKKNKPILNNNLIERSFFNTTRKYSNSLISNKYFKAITFIEMNTFQSQPLKLNYLLHSNIRPRNEFPVLLLSFSDMFHFNYSLFDLLFKNTNTSFVVIQEDKFKDVVKKLLKYFEKFSNKKNISKLGSQFLLDTIQILRNEFKIPIYLWNVPLNF
ncbi:myb-like protein x [Anaeramoeba flamelloides]|uniref:Myb-like protein x n=1 Tax=Anaeramoeba flamelloides TaxID=1746091 RepID=A0ABQ8XYV3_9EUKA|nr:myb-like protein x [Anaeramoeba flamelloides]